MHSLMRGVRPDIRSRQTTTVLSKRVSAAGSQPSAMVGDAALLTPIYGLRYRVAGSTLSPVRWQPVLYSRSPVQSAWNISGAVSEALPEPNARSFFRPVSSVHR